MPASVPGGKAGAALLVLPSEEAPVRHDAMHVQQLLGDIAAAPAEAADRWARHSVHRPLFHMLSSHCTCASSPSRRSTVKVQKSYS
jgi:hypothetical protein